MKNKLFLLLTTSLLLAGCSFTKPKTSSNSSEVISSLSSETSSEKPASSEAQSSEVNSQNQSSETSSETSSEASSLPDGEYGYGYYNNYYGQLTWTNGEDLKQKLHDIIRNGWNPLRYNTPNWETNTYADHSRYDFEYVDAVYSAKDIPVSQTNTAWQREHVFAASLMTGQLTAEAVKTPGRATDFHNLMAGESSANGSRGNKNFGVADKTNASYTDRTTDNGNDGYSFDPKTFEPGNKDKGRLARAIFYMGTMYKDAEGDYQGLTIIEENVEYTSGNCQYAIGHLSELLTWSNTYDVDYLEMQHNESVYSHVYSKDGKAQNNRNPFVDYPELVNYVYGDKQNESGDLKYLKPSSYVLESDKNEFSHYAIESAKREFSYGDTLTSADFKVVSVNKNYSYSEVTTGFTHSLLNHTFTTDDGDSINATITAGEQTITYTISLDPMKSCSFQGNFVKDGISTSKIDVDQNVTYGGKNFTINVTSTSGYTLTNDNSNGGFKMGSSTKPVTKVVITTANTYTIDKAFIKCFASNTSSSFNLKITVGETELYSGTVAYAKTPSIYGDIASSPLTGKVCYTFTGTNAINLVSLAFNEVN